MLALAVASQQPQNCRIIGIQRLALQRRDELGSGRAYPERPADHIEVVGVRDQHVAEELRIAEKLHQHFQTTRLVAKQLA